MANGQLDLVLRHIRRLIGPSEGAGELSDRVLLERFASQREEIVFEALLHRHGSLVLSVCRRVLQNEHDAEDVFQAVFLVLARKAGSIRKHASLGSWLYGVAYRLALKAKAAAARRRDHERRYRAMALTQSAQEGDWRLLGESNDLSEMSGSPLVGRMLAEELHRLPERHRAPLVLCYLEGKTNVEAARVLGWSPGSMAKRLARARELLRSRFAARGLVLSSAGLAALLQESARATVPAALIQSSLQAALLVAGGQAAAGIVSAQAILLAEGVKAMFPTKLKILAVLVLGAGLVAAGAGLVGRHQPAELMALATQTDEQPKAAAAGRDHADLALVPANAMGFARISVRDLWTSEAMKRVRDKMDKPGLEAQQEMEKRLGVAFADLESITLILLPPTDKDLEPQVVTAFTTIEPYARPKVQGAIAPDGQEQEYKGKKFVAPQPLGGVALCFVTERTFFLGSPRDLHTYFDQATPRSKGPLSSALKLAAGNHAAVAGFRVPEIVAQAMKKAELPPTAQYLKPLIDLESGTLVVDFNGDMQLKGNLQLPDEDSAKEAADAVRTGLGVLKGILATPTPDLQKDPLITAALQEMVATLKTARVTQKEASVEVTMQTKALPLLGMALPAIEKTRKASKQIQSANNLKQIALAMHNYHDTYQHFPPAAIRDKDGTPLLSWRVAILPFIEQDQLYKQFKLDEPWDSEHNKKLLKEMPIIYAPVTGTTKEPYTTFYQVFTGNGTAFDKPEGVRFADITDGTSNTLMAVEAGEPVPWTKPQDLRYDPKKPLPRLGGLFPDGFHAAYCDGSVRLILKGVKENTLRALITRDGGEVIGDKDLP